MGAVLVRAFLYFAAAFVAIYALSFLVFGIWRKSPAAPGAGFLETAALAAYVLMVTAVPAAFGFAIVTSPWPAFRNLAPSRVAWLSAAGGAATYLARLTGIDAVLFRIPLPGGLGPIGAALRLLLPGIASGVLMLGAALLLRLAPSPAVPAP